MLTEFFAGFTAFKLLLAAVFPIGDKSDVFKTDDRAFGNIAEGETLRRSLGTLTVAVSTSNFLQKVKHCIKNP